LIILSCKGDTLSNNFKFELQFDLLEFKGFFSTPKPLVLGLSITLRLYNQTATEQIQFSLR